MKLVFFDTFLLYLRSMVGKLRGWGAGSAFVSQFVATAKGF